MTHQSKYFQGFTSRYVRSFGSLQTSLLSKLVLSVSRTNCFPTGRSSSMAFVIISCRALTNFSCQETTFFCMEWHHQCLQMTPWLCMPTKKSSFSAKYWNHVHLPHPTFATRIASQTEFLTSSTAPCSTHGVLKIDPQLVEELNILLELCFEAWQPRGKVVL